MKSKLIEGSTVTFPQFTGERVYLEPFTIEEGLPSHLMRWDKTVKQMLSGINTDQVICLTVDQSFVIKGESQRRGGKHVDCPVDIAIRAHGGTPTRHSPAPPPTHSPVPRHTQTSGISHSGIIVASSHIGCRGWSGDISGEAENFGDCDHLDVSDAKEIIMQPSRSYLANGTMVHEVMLAESDQFRTFVRLSL